MPIVASIALLLSTAGPAPAGVNEPARPGAGGPAAAEVPEAAEPARPGAADDNGYLEQAPLDVETILSDSSRAYLDARARLEAHPALAAEAILDRMTTVPPPTSTDRKRLLDVLAALGLTDHVDLFADELRRAIKRAGSFTDQTKAVERWLPLLADQGEAALAPLSALVADKKIPVTIRVTLLDAMVMATPTARLGELVSLVGRGTRSLRRQLQRSLKRRAGSDPAARTALVATADEALTAAEPARLPALLSLRGALAGADDAAFTARLAGLAQDDTAGFPVRVAALRALGGRTSPEAHQALIAVAHRSLAPEARDTQRGEILGWLALQGLPEAEVRPLVERYALIDDDAPRLAVVGYAWASLPGDHGWLAPALENPWPQVRQAAIARVEGPCPATTGRLLEDRAHLAGRRSEDDRVVARSAIVALGRCRAVDRLIGLLKDEQLDLELRSESARQLARLGTDQAVNAIGWILARNPERAFARRLASALRHMPAPTPAGDAILCTLATQGSEAGHAARESLRALHDDLQSACQ